MILRPDPPSRFPRLLSEPRRRQRGFITPALLGVVASRQRNNGSDPYFSSVQLLMHADGSNGSASFIDVKGHTITAGGQIVQRTAQPKYGTASGTGDQLTNDPFWSQVSMLLHLDGTDGSTTITDVKGNTVTAAGGFALDTGDKQFGTASGENVSGGRFSFPQSSAFDFGAGDFTIEFWLKATGTPAGSNRIFQSRNGDVVPGIYLSWSDSTTLQLYASTNGSSFNLGPVNFTFTTGTWRHIAIARCSAVGTLITVYVDGAAVGRMSVGANSLYYNAADTWVWMGQTTPNRSTLGWIDEVRITKGVARYVSSAADGNIQVFPKPVSAFLEQGGNNGSPYFSHPSTDFNLGTADWTIEFWVYPNQLSPLNARILQFADGDVVNGLSFSISANNAIYASLSSNGSSFNLGTVTSGATVLTPLTWAHVALTRNGATITLWIDGVSRGTLSVASNAIYHNAAVPWYWFGQSTPYRSADLYFDEVRVTVGVCRYTATFTPPSAAFPDS